MRATYQLCAGSINGHIIAGTFITKLLGEDRNTVDCRNTFDLLHI